MKIINPLDDKEKLNAIQEAFLKPDLFNKLYSKTLKNESIQISFLGNLLIREYGIQISAKNEFLSTFIKSGIIANLVEYSTDKQSIILKNAEETSIDHVDEEKKETEEKPFMNPQVQTVELILSTGKAKIIVPKELTEIDAKKLKAQINILANIFD